MLLLLNAYVMSPMIKNILESGKFHRESLIPFVLLPALAIVAINNFNKAKIGLEK